MSDCCIKFKNKLEKIFSMPFEVSMSIFDGEEQYSCYPSNSEEIFFAVKAYIHDQIRLVVEIAPQKNAGAILNDMAHADSSQRKIFFQYIDLLSSEKAKVTFSVNNELISSEKSWPENWRYFKCRIDLIPIPEVGGADELSTLLAEWLIHGTALILSLLTVEENVPSSDLSPEQEGEAREIKSKRYERSRVNRDICLAHKGYSCYACGFNFLERYGLLGKDYIEVHHTTPVSEMGDDYRIDIDRDLVPVCSNCHSMLHRKKPPYTIKELKEIIAQNGGCPEPEVPKMKVIQIFPKYKSGCIPLYTMYAACGLFTSNEKPEEEGWVDVSGYGFTPDKDKYFIIHAKGDSMNPKIKDGDLCVFEWYNQRCGTREGDIVLVYREGKFDDGSNYTIKRYHSEKVPTDEGLQHKRIVLLPINPDYNPIELSEDMKLYTIGVLKCVL